MLVAMALWRDRRRGPWLRLPARVSGGSTRCSTSGSTATTATARCSAVLEDGTGASREQLRDQLVTLLAAGHETTAGALGWALERLARHPEVARAHARGRRRLPRRRRQGGAARAAGAGDRRRARSSSRIELGGWTLPPGVHVTPCIYLAHRRADVWEDPTAFRPERFLDGAPEPYTFIPFGGGVRRCVGAAFASLEMKRGAARGRAPVRAAAGGRAAASGCAGGRSR